MHYLILIFLVFIGLMMSQDRKISIQTVLFFMIAFGPLFGFMMVFISEKLPNIPENKEIINT